MDFDEKGEGENGAAAPMQIDDEDKRLAEIKVVFSMFDKNGNGRISKQELDDLLASIGQSATDSLLQDIIGEVDGDGGGEITFDDFVTMMSDDTIEEITDASEAEAKGAFEVFSEHSAGKFISLEGLKATLASFGHKLSTDQCRSIMKEINPADESKITLEELKAFLDAEDGQE